MATETDMGKEQCALFPLIENRNWSDVIEWVKKNPSDASVGLESFMMCSDHANLALHEACKNQPPLEVITALLDANSEAVKVKGQWGYLPLHYACSSGASDEVIAKLVAVYPSGARTKDTNKEALPLHLACNWGMSEDALMKILTTYPEAIYIKDASGKTALDYGKALNIPEVRESTLKSLKLGPFLCAASKAATERVYQDKETRIKAMAEAQAAHVVKLEARYLDQLNGERAKVVTLTTELNAERKENESKNVELEMKVEEIFDLKEKMNKDAAEASIAIEHYTRDLEEERATIENLKTNLENEKHLNDHLEQELKVQKRENDRLNLKVEDDTANTVFFVSEVEKALGFVDQVEADRQTAKSREQLQELVDSVNEKVKAIEAFQPLFEEADKDRRDLKAVLETERKEARSTRDEAQNRIENLEAELAGEREAIVILKETIHQLEEMKTLTEQELTDEKDKVENLLADMDCQKREHMLKLAELQEVVRCKESDIAELECNLDVHQRAEKNLANKAVKFEKMRQEAAQELRDTLAELSASRIEAGDLQRKLANANRKNETYVRRMETLHKWVSSLSYSMKTWRVENEWEQKYSDNDDSLNVMATLNEPPPARKRVDSDGEETEETEPGSVKLMSSSSSEEHRSAALPASPPMKDIEYLRNHVDETASQLENLQQPVLPPRSEEDAVEFLRSEVV